jgi:signal transduction histidine kinase
VLVATSYLLVRQRLGPSTDREVATTLCRGSANGVVCLRQKVGSAPASGATQPVPGPDGDQVITAGQIAALPSTFVSAAMNTFLQTMLLVLGLMALLSLGLGWVVAGRVLRPLQQITATAKRLSERTLHQRIALEGPDDELKELADTFDRMLSRLDAAFDSQRRFTANASHELRTPLAISRTEVDLALSDPDTSTAELRAMAERVRDATDRSERLIEGLLTLSRSEQEPRTPEPDDLADAAGMALEDASRSHGPAGGLLVAATLRPAPVEGDPALLERMVANLVENAERHNQPGGWLEITTGTGDGWAFVRVANGGPETPADQVESLFEPFRRLNGRIASTAPGAGLGLSIVRSVARAHGADARARALPGGGLEITVRLPARGSRPALTASSARPAAT